MATRQVICYRQSGKVEFIAREIEEEAQDEAPWAVILLPCQHGFMAFELSHDAAQWYEDNAHLDPMARSTSL